MGMRIIAGEFKGRRIKLPADLGIRPTQDRIREAMFSTLNSYIDIEGAVALDLFTGSGSLGLEAISRGAKGCLLVEEKPRVATLLEQTLREIGADDRGVVLRGSLPGCLTQASAAPFFRRVGAKAEKFDLVFIDPPYDHNPGVSMIEELVRRRLVGDGSLVLLEARAPGAEGEISDERRLADPELAIDKLKRRIYGQTTVDYFLIRDKNRPDAQSAASECGDPAEELKENTAGQE
jgi:16S rRNA (guanine966-N2)-methyltransferase